MHKTQNTKSQTNQSEKKIGTEINWFCTIDRRLDKYEKRTERY